MSTIPYVNAAPKIYICLLGRSDLRYTFPECTEDKHIGVYTHVCVLLSMLPPSMNSFLKCLLLLVFPTLLQREVR